MKKFYLLAFAALASLAGQAQTKWGIQRTYEADLGRFYDSWKSDYQADDPESPLYVTSDGVGVNYVEGPGVTIYTKVDVLDGIEFVSEEKKSDFYVWDAFDPEGDASGGSEANHVFKVFATLTAGEDGKADVKFEDGQYFGFDLQIPEGKAIDLSALELHAGVGNNIGFYMTITQNGTEKYNSGIWVNKNYRAGNAHIGDFVKIDKENVTGVDVNILAEYPEITIESSCCPHGGSLNRVPAELVLSGNVNVKVFYCWPREREEGVADETTMSNKSLMFDHLYLYGELTDATGINVVAADNVKDNAIYSIAGQRVSENFKGIAIQNGKKVIK